MTSQTLVVGRARFCAQLTSRMGEACWMISTERSGKIVGYVAVKSGALTRAANNPYTINRAQEVLAACRSQLRVVA